MHSAPRSASCWRSSSRTSESHPRQRSEPSVDPHPPAPGASVGGRSHLRLRSELWDTRPESGDGDRTLFPAMATLSLCVWAASGRVGLGATSQTNRSAPITPRQDFAPLQDIDQLPVGHVGGNGPHQDHMPAPPGSTDHSGGVGRTDRAIGKPMSSERTDCRLGTSAEALVVWLVPPRSAAFAQGDLGCVYPLPSEPHAIRITRTVRRADRTSSRHQLVHELLSERRRNRRIGPPPAAAIDRDPPCVVVHTPALPTTGRSERIGCVAPPSSRAPVGSSQVES